MERGVQLIDFENTDSMVVIHDYKGASLFGRTANAKAATKEIIKIMQDNYPEFLVRKQSFSERLINLCCSLLNFLSIFLAGESKLQMIYDLAGFSQICL